MKPVPFLSTSVRLGRFLFLVSLVLGLSFFCLPGAQSAVVQSTTDVSTEDLHALLATLEDPSARETLVGQLKALIAARGQPKAADEELYIGTGLIAGLAGEIKRTSEQLVAAATVLRTAPNLFDWVKGQVTDPDRLALWGDVVLHVLLIAAIGLLAEWAIRALLVRPRALIESRGDDGRLLGAVFLILWIVIELLPVAVFAVVSYALMPVLQLRAGVRDEILTAVAAYVAIRTGMIVARSILAPVTPARRLLPLSDETAQYLYIWSRRFIGVAFGGYFMVEAARLSGYALAMKFLGMVIATMIVIFILQNRRGVADFIRGARAERSGLQSLRNRIADIWHVLAVVYISVTCLVWMFGVAGGFEYVFRATVLSLIIVAGAGVATTALRRALTRVFAIKAEVRARFPTLEMRANRYVPILHAVIRVVVWTLAGLAVLESWGVDSFAWMARPFGQRLLTGGFSILMVLLIALIVWETASSAIERYLNGTDRDGRPIERGTRIRTLLPLLKNVLFIVLGVMVSLIVLSELGVNIGPLLAGAGVIGLALGIGSQKLVQDVITGAFILFEDSIGVGDSVSVGGQAGTVEAVTIRSVRLRDVAGAVHMIPFSSVGIVSNMSRNYAYAVFSIGVGYRENVDEVMEVMAKVGAEMQEDPELGRDILAPLDVEGIEALADSAVVIKAKFKTQPKRQGAVSREFYRRIKNRFDELGIEIPYPHTTLYFGESKDGSAPAARIVLERARPMKTPE